MKISLGTVSFTEETATFLNQIIKTQRVGQGEFIKKFEAELQNFFGVKHAIAVANGTAADAISLAACRYKNPTDKNEVILPAMTFIAQANAILEAGFKPVFVDVSDDYQVDVEQMESKITEKNISPYACASFWAACKYGKDHAASREIRAASHRRHL